MTSYCHPFKTTVYFDVLISTLDGDKDICIIYDH